MSLTPVNIVDADLPFGAPNEIPLGADQQVTTNEPAKQPAIDFEMRKKQIVMLIGDWKEEKDRVDIRRKLRKNRKNVQELRQEQAILEDETVIADHTIDQNISAEKAAYMQYLETSRTLLTFTPRPYESIPRDILTQLEETFTLGARYDRWKIPWYKIIDGCLLHGAIGFEIVFDETKPFHFSIDYIRRENFIYPTKMTDIEKSDMYLRVFEYPVVQFETWRKTGQGWNMAALDDIIKRHEQYRNKLIEIYKVYFKQDGIVYSGWYSDTPNVTTWLQDPKPHHIGELVEEVIPPDPMAVMMNPGLAVNPPTTWKPVPCKEFPFVLFRYTETEDEVVLEIPGRASMDVYTQEAITELLTSTVNGAHRASGLYVSCEPTLNDSPNPGTVKLKHGLVVQGKVTTHQLPWPNTIALSVIQALSVRNASQMGRTDFAAMSRQDTAKTASEINAAQTQAAALGSIKVSLFADAITRAYMIGWSIARSQALSGQINDFEAFPPEVLKHEYTLTPSGDVEVIKRQEKLQQMKEFFSVIANTPAAVPFLKLLIRAAFPEDSRELVAALDAGDKDIVINELANALETAMPSLPPQEQDDLRKIIASARSMAIRPADAGAAQQAGPAGAAPSQSGNEPLPREA